MNPETNLLRLSATEIKSVIREWGQRNFREYRWRDCQNLWLVLIAEIMLQRTRVTAVEPVWHRFSEKFDSPQKVVNADPDEVRELFRPLGLGWRVDKVIDLAKALVETGGIPDTKKDLTTLPGVGDYISSALLSLHMNRRYRWSATRTILEVR